ncbi:MAG: efflux RND transporter periplasmic adaptor subunit, partial [Bacteroidetes bacterium]|nr:efflux RND transporter periplasmic adaptor subunit [Bacteroidota bacterium]
QNVQEHSCEKEQTVVEKETGHHDHDEHYGDRHGIDDETKMSDFEEVTCEHNVSIVDCDYCRFEVGVVKIDKPIESLIEIGLVQDIERANILTFTGQVRLDSTRTVDVVPTGGGQVRNVIKFLGEKVKKGDTLAVIHSDDLGQAKADFLEIQAKLELVGTTFKREKNLYEKKISSEADYLNALNELKAVEASYAATEIRLLLFGLETEQITGIKEEKEKGEFANMILRAPRAGTIIRQNISIGKIVDTTESLHTISDLTNLSVWCDIYEKDLAVLHEQFSRDKSLQAVVRVKAFPSTKFDGLVDLIDNLMDENTRTVKMRVQVKNPENKLRPGMFVDVDVAISQQGHMLAVPQTAVMSDAGKNFVFQYWKNDLWVRRDVAIGDKYGDLIEILNGVLKGSKIVTGGAFMLKSDILREKMGAGCAD